MFRYMFKDVLVPLILRLGLAVIFVYHGLGKINEGTEWGTHWAGDSMPTALQIAVAYGELLGGIALGLGFLTRLASLGIIALMAGAIATVTGQHGFNNQDKGFEYNFALIVIALAVFLLGAGPVSFDRYMFAPRRRT
jgi:putative oxidoreductase